MYFNAQQKNSCQMAAHCKNWGFTAQGYAWALETSKMFIFV